VDERPSGPSQEGDSDGKEERPRGYPGPLEAKPIEEPLMAQPIGPGELPIKYESGVLVNPTSGCVLVDTGNFLKTRIYKVVVTVSSNMGGEIEFQHRASGNAGNVYDTPIFTGSQAPAQFFFIEQIELDERVRVVYTCGQTGSISVTLNVLQAVSGPTVGYY